MPRYTANMKRTHSATARRANELRERIQRLPEVEKLAMAMRGDGACGSIGDAVRELRALRTVINDLFALHSLDADCYGGPRGNALLEAGSQAVHDRLRKQGAYTAA